MSVAVPYAQEKGEEYSHDEFKGSIEAPVEHDKAFERATIRRIDIRLLIVLGATYSISLIDRTNTAQAAVAGMNKALSLQLENRYSIISLLFFIPYILFELPAMIVLRKVGARNFLAFIVLAWGSVMVGMAFVKTWQALAVCRTILGIFESGFFPCCVLIITTWYKRAEVAKRLSLFYLTSQAISGFANIIGYGMSLLNGQHGLQGWQWIFLCWGLITMSLSVLCYLFVVDFPDTNTFLSPEQTAFVLQRIEADRGDSQYDPMTLAKVGLHLSDWKGWASAILFMCATTPSYAFAYFLPIVLSSGGFSVKLSLLLSAPPYLAAAIWTFAVAYLSDKYQQRSAAVFTNATVCLVGLLIMSLTKPLGIRYFGAFLSIMGAQANVPAVLTYQSNNVRSQSKRAVHAALVIGFGGIGGILASTTFRSVDAPLYHPGLGVSAGCQGLTLVIVATSYMFFKSQNRKADAGEVVLENLPGFRYTL